MNNILGLKSRRTSWKEDVEDLMGNNCSRWDKKCFIGWVEDETEEKLYMISYLGVIDLENPEQTWSCSGTIFHIIKWVDVDIYIQEG